MTNTPSIQSQCIILVSQDYGKESGLFHLQDLQHCINVTDTIRKLKSVHVDYDLVCICTYSVYNYVHTVCICTYSVYNYVHTYIQCVYVHVCISNAMRDACLNLILLRDPPKLLF